MTSYSTLIETIRLSCTVFELERVFRRKWPILTHPTCICRRRSGWSRSNFAMIFGIRKEPWGYRAALFAWSYVKPFLIQYWSVTDTHTDRHTTTAYTARSIASRGKKCFPVTSAIRWSNGESALVEFSLNESHVCDRLERSEWNAPQESVSQCSTAVLTQVRSTSQSYGDSKFLPRDAIC